MPFNPYKYGISRTPYFIYSLSVLFNPYKTFVVCEFFVSLMRLAFIPRHPVIYPNIRSEKPPGGRFATPFFQNHHLWINLHLQEVSIVCRSVPHIVPAAPVEYLTDPLPVL